MGAGVVGTKVSGTTGAPVMGAMVTGAIGFAVVVTRKVGSIQTSRSVEGSSMQVHRTDQ
jgi:hypothetical protein